MTPGDTPPEANSLLKTPDPAATCERLAATGNEAGTGREKQIDAAREA